jgi:hypothetical protein
MPKRAVGIAATVTELHRQASGAGPVDACPTRGPWVRSGSLHVERSAISAPLFEHLPHRSALIPVTLVSQRRLMPFPKPLRLIVAAALALAAAPCMRATVSFHSCVLMAGGAVSCWGR